MTEGVYLLCGTRLDQAGFRCLVGASVTGGPDAEVGGRFCEENGVITKELFKKVCSVNSISTLALPLLILSGREWQALGRYASAL